MKILLSEDTDLGRDLIKAFLEPLHFEIDTTSDGLAALTQLKINPNYDALMLDWDMPQLSGLELLKILRGDPQFDNIKIIMITGHNEIEHVKDALEYGANEYLMKPFSQEMLLEKLELLGIDVR